MNHLPRSPQRQDERPLGPQPRWHRGPAICQALGSARREAILDKGDGDE
jgi:hypothetical protein